jgi:hypothetical protein
MQNNDFKHSISIPVPIGETVWTFWTDCCGACYFQPRDNTPIRCDAFAPCHTFIHTIQPVELKYSNLETILRLWGKKYFYTENEARNAVEKLTKEHIDQMRKLGYKINDDGTAEKEDGWEDAIDDYK